MTSDEGRRALDASLSVTVEPAIDQADVRAAWQAAIPGELAAHAHLTCTPAGNGTRIALRASRTHFDAWSAALAMEDLLARLGESPRQTKPHTNWQQRRAAERAQLDGANRTRHVAFWSEMLKGAPLPVPFAQRSLALAPVGFGLNRGPTARVSALLTNHAANESMLLAAFTRALAEATDRSDLVIACDIDGRASEHERTVIGPLATTVPLVCRVDATEPPEALAARLARDLRHARAHAAFDLAACEDAFGAAWRAAGPAPRQIGFSCAGQTSNTPLLMATNAPLQFGRLTVRRDEDDNAIENDLRLVVTPTEHGALAVIAFDRDVVGAAFAEALRDAIVREMRKGVEAASRSPELSAQIPR